MSRSGYSDDHDQWSMIKWRGQVMSAIRGKRGQEFFVALVEALDAMPEKRLIKDEIQDDDGCFCAFGALAQHKGLDPSEIDPHEHHVMGQLFNIAHQLAQEVMFENDEAGSYRETPEQRWSRMRQWAQSNIKKAGA